MDLYGDWADVRLTNILLIEHFIYPCILSPDYGIYSGGTFFDDFLKGTAPTSVSKGDSYFIERKLKHIFKFPLKYVLTSTGHTE